MLALVVLVRAFARGQKLVDVGEHQGQGNGLLSSYTWSILALHFLLHERYVPNLHCNSSTDKEHNKDSQDSSTNNNINSSKQLLQSLTSMTSEQAVIALQQPVDGLVSGSGRGRGRDPVTYLTRLEETTPLALLRDMFQVGD